MSSTLQPAAPPNAAPSNLSSDSQKAGPLLPSVANGLRSIRARIATWFVLEGLGYFVWLALALAAVSFVLDYFFHFDIPQRAVLLVAMLAGLAYAFFRGIVRPCFTSLSDDALILQVEKRNPTLAEVIISAVQFHRAATIPAHASPAMIAATIARGSKAAESVRFDDVIDRSGLSRNVWRLLSAMAVLLGLLALAAMVPHLRVWFQRDVLLRSTPWPQNTYLRILRAEDGRIRIPRGDDYTLQVVATPDSNVTPERVYIDFRDGRDSLALKTVQQGQYEVALANVIQPFQFRVRGGDEYTDYVTVELVEPPALAEISLQVRLPKYAGGQVEMLQAGKGPYFILPGSSLSLLATANKPLTKALLSREDQRMPLEISDHLNVRGELAAEQLHTGQYTIELTDSEGLQARRPTTFGLRMRADREPRVRARLLGIGGIVTARARLPITGRVTDDYGISSVDVPYIWRGDDEARKSGSGSIPLPSSTSAPNKLDLSVDDVLELEPLAIPPGTGLSFHVAATDNDDFPDDPAKAGGPNVGKSPDFNVRVVTDEELRSDLLRREKEQRQEFERLVKQQDDLLTFSRELVAQLKQAGDLTSEHKDRLAQGSKQQKLIATNCATVGQRLASIVTEIVNNRLEEGIDEDKRPLETRIMKKIVEPLAGLQIDGFPASVQLFEQARRSSGEPASRESAMQQLVEHHTKLVAIMKQILSEMSQAEGYQEAINLIYEVEKMQREVFERTRKAKEEREKGILQDSAASKKDSQPPAAEKPPSTEK